MKSEPRRFFPLWLVPLLLANLATVRGQDKPLDEPAPVPTVAVQQLLDEAAVASSRGDAALALGLADRALAAAQQATDTPGDALTQRTRAQQLVKLDRNVEAVAAWRDAEAARKRIGDGAGQIEALGWQAVLVFRDHAQQGTELLRRAIALAETETKRPRAAASSLVDVGRALLNRSRLSEAQQTFEAAVAITGRVAPESIESAAAVNGLGILASTRGDLTAARDYFQRALTIREALAPDSPAVASSLTNLGIVAEQRGELSVAREYHLRALALSEKVAPDSLDVAVSLSNLGNVVRREGDLSAARDYHQRTLEIREKLVPNSIDVARGLNNLGVVAMDQGDLSAARDYYQRALAIKAKLAPDSIDVATTLNNLGIVARNQGDVSAARDFYQRSLAIHEKLAPNSLAVATCLNNLGIVAATQGDLSAARDYQRRALAIDEKLAPNSLAVALSLNNLGVVAETEGNLTEAQDYHQRALAIREKLAPNSLDVAMSLDNLGTVAALGKASQSAAAYHQRSLAIKEKLAPNSLDVAATLKELGNAAYEQGDVASAAQHTTRAWAIVRGQSAVVAGDEARQAFQSQFQAIGSQLVRFQLALGKTDEAFITLEEGRAQALLQLMAERGIARRLAPADVWQRYELAQTASNRDGKTLETAGEAETRAMVSLDAEVAQQSAATVVEEKRRTLADREQATEQARLAYTRSRVEAEGRWADVRSTIQGVIPAPTTPAEARRLLPPDTILAAFAVGEKDSTLFLVQRDGPVQAFTLALPLKELVARVDFVRRSVSREAGARGLKLQESDDVRAAAARDLYRKLFPPVVREAIGRCKRLLLSPDGALWDLPFAALVINDEGKPQYLGLEKPLVYTQSLTTLAHTLRATAPPRPERPKVLVVGNPLYDNALRNRSTKTQATPQLTAASRDGARAQGELALLSRDGEIPAPLPYAEEEANQVAALYGVRAATGAEPTEAWFRQRAPEADIIHLATHGYFNPLRAVSSGLRLAVPEREPGPHETDNDGALQAWEVFNLQQRADLVVLSACQTGVGSKVPGEGLVGLTRAFQVAGAATIVATQWSVSDKSTARGMVAFHQNLRRGLDKDEALRQSMQKVANDPTTGHPYYWAPFILIGDFHPLRTFFVAHEPPVNYSGPRLADLPREERWSTHGTGPPLEAVSLLIIEWNGE